MSEDRVRVFLVDDHDLVRAGTRAILGDAYEIVGEADAVEPAIDLIREREPDLVLLDVRLPGGGGASVIEGVRQTHPDVVFLALTVSSSRDDVIRLLTAGVDGYVTKSTYSDELPEYIEAALDGQRPIAPEVAGYLLDIDDDIDVAASGLDRLTPKERQVVGLIARGYSYRETSKELDISVKTLETHMKHIFDKLGVASRHELTARAYETGFVRPDDGPDAP